MQDGIDGLGAVDVGMRLLGAPVLMRGLLEVQFLHHLADERPVQGVLVGVHEDQEPFALPMPGVQGRQDVGRAHSPRIG